MKYKVVAIVRVNDMKFEEDGKKIVTEIGKIPVSALRAVPVGTAQNDTAEYMILDTNWRQQNADIN